MLIRRNHFGLKTVYEAAQKISFSPMATQKGGVPICAPNTHVRQNRIDAYLLANVENHIFWGATTFSTTCLVSKQAMDPPKEVVVFLWQWDVKKGWWLHLLALETEQNSTRDKEG